MFTIFNAMEQTMDEFCKNSQFIKYNCPSCGKETPKEDIEDLGKCRACDHLELDNTDYET